MITRFDYDSLRICSCNKDSWKLVITRFTVNKEMGYVELQTNLPIFKHKESSVRRRYSDFEWLRGELERDSKVFCCYYRLMFHLKKLC